ncbi:MAG: hypothetical protein PHO03_06305, partial [Candidatus Omnitrophica bacterium]|nr:hypothetical protein [Candidatus Omnitrophota bacterium]
NWTPINENEGIIETVASGYGEAIKEPDQKLLDYLATREANKLLYNRNVKVMVYSLVLKKWVLPRKVI